MGLPPFTDWVLTAIHLCALLACFLFLSYMFLVFQIPQTNTGILGLLKISQVFWDKFQELVIN